MKFLLKIVTVVLIAILLFSSYYVAFYMESEDSVPTSSEGKDYQDDDNNDNTGGNDDNGNDNENDNGDSDSVHTVFIEEASYPSCEPCVKIAEILEHLYESGKYNFYYVSLVRDMSDQATKRVNEELNVVGYPVVYIDGGYKVFFSGSVPESDIIKGILDAEKRKIPKINVNITAEYNENKSELSTNINVVNNEKEQYNGRIRVYLTEIISRWNQQNGKPYHFALVDYIINKEITIAGKDELTIPDKKNITQFAIPDLDPANLMVVAVIFNSESEKRDSFPGNLDKQNKKGEFDAYFADATSATLVIPGGNLPPSAGLSLPEPGKLHIFGRPIYKLKLLKKTILIGKIKIVADVEDDSGIEKVEIYINGELKKTLTNKPYEYSYSRLVYTLTDIVKKITISVIVYDDEGKTDSASIEVIAVL